MRAPFLTLCFLISLLSFHGSVEAASLHAVIVCDTTESTIGINSKRDCEKLELELDKMAFYSGLQLKTTRLLGLNATPQKVKNTLRKLNASKNDVIFFYFSGHGVHRESQKGSRWPELYFSLINKTIDLQDVIQEVQNRKPRLSIILADSCNNLVDDDLMPPQYHFKSLKSPNPNNDNQNRFLAYRKLLSKIKGTVIAVGSIEGEYTYAANTGSYFTMTFFRVLAEMAKQGSAIEWEDLLWSVRDELINEWNIIPDYHLEILK